MRIDSWLRQSRVWVPPVVLLLVSLGLLFAFRLVVSVSVGNREAALEERRSELEAARVERRQLEAVLADARESRRRIETLRSDRFDTRAGRLTAAMLRVRELAEDAGLAGQETVSYPEEDVVEYGLIRKSFVFGVRGSYAELRRFVNLLELNESFLTLEEIRVSSGQRNELDVRVRLSTLFVDDRSGQGGLGT